MRSESSQRPREALVPGSFRGKSGSGPEQGPAAAPAPWGFLLRFSSGHFGQRAGSARGLSGPERREQKRLGARGIQLSALDHIGSGRSVAEVPTLMQRVEIHIDGWPRADWTVYQEVRKVLLDGR